MRRTTLALLLACAPVYLAAQSQDEGKPESRPASERRILAGFSAETRLQLEAMLQVARERELPTEPMTDRMAEGQTKGASEAQILVATRRVHAELVTAQTALIRAGREHPSDAEVERGAQLIARGATSAQLEAFVRSAPSDRRLEVAFEVLGNLAARGIPVDQAIAVVGANLNGTSAVSAGGAGVQAGATTGATGGASALGSSVTGTVTGKVGIGIGRKP